MATEKYLLDNFVEQSDFMQTTVRENIEKYRKGDLSITVKDEKGKLIDGASVKIEQQSHEFKFGANIFMLDELESKEKNDAYKSRFVDLFNMATLPFYWDTLEPRKGEPRYSKDSEKIYRRPAPDLCLEFCEKHGIEPREHALAYDHFFPDWLRNADVEEVKRALENRYAEIASRYKDKIRTIEVTNEMFWDQGTTSFYDDPNFLIWCYDTAKKYFPNNEITINEDTRAWSEKNRVTDSYYSYVDALLGKGVRIDAIGMQFHMFHKREERMREKKHYDPKKMYKTMDLYSRFGKPLQISEITIPSYSWESDDEQLQADIIENIYRIWFSHPAVEQIIYWNLVDGYAYVWLQDVEEIKKTQGDMQLGENYYHGGLLRFDLSPKPAYLRLKNLIKNEWTTNSTISTQNGNAQIKAFFGSYIVTVEKDGKKVEKSISLCKKDGKSNIEIIL